MRAGQLDRFVLLLVLIGSVGGATLAYLYGSAHAQAVAYPPTPNDPLDLDGLSVDYLRALQLDAGVVWTPRIANPDGGFLTVSGQGLYTQTSWLQPLARAAVPACTLERAGWRLHVLTPGAAADGGSLAQPQWCTGEHWETQAFSYGLNTDPKAGNGPFFVLSPLLPGQFVAIAAAVDELGSGGGSFEIILRQGSRVLCRGGTTCTAPVARTFAMPCVNATFTVDLDGGSAHKVVAEVDGGCGNSPGIHYTADSRIFGYPDPGWTP